MLNDALYKFMWAARGPIVILAVLPECRLLRSSVDVIHSYLNVVCWYVG